MLRMLFGTQCSCRRSSNYLACLAFLLIKHVEEISELTGQTELSLTQVTYQSTAQWLDEI